MAELYQRQAQAPAPSMFGAVTLSPPHLNASMTSYETAHSITDFRELARRSLPRMVFDFIDGGSGSESTLNENRRALDRIRLIASAPVNVGARSQSIKIFGQELALPVIIGPTGLAGAAWPEADLHLARAAAKCGTRFVMSTAASATMEQVAAAADGHAWFQLYLFKDRDFSLRLLKKAKDLRFGVIEVTVDNAIPGKRLRDARNGFSLPLRWTPAKLLSVLARPGWLLRVARHGAPTLALMAEELGLQQTETIAELMQTQLDPTLSWEDIQWVRDRWDGPLVVKGLLDPEQGARAAQIGADGIVVSNHGGRQLDGAVSTIDILPEFVTAVKNRIPIIVDSGFRSGTDVAKALALGATAVQLGRSTLYAAAAGGEPAIVRAIQLIQSELDICQCLMGAPEIASFNSSMVRSTTMMSYS